MACICRGGGIDAPHFFPGIGEPAIKDQRRADTDEVTRRGSFGSATMFVDGADLHFGSGRLPVVGAALRSATATPPLHRACG